MKHWLSFVALVCFGSTAQANPYFRLIDPAHVQKVAGAYIDPETPGDTAYGTSIALITHSTKDGCLFPTVVCEDWSPLMVGPSYSAGRFQANLGPAFNMAPLAKAGLLGALSYVTNDDQLAGVKSALSSVPIQGAELSFSFGPALQVAPVQHGVLVPLNQWQGKLRIFAGASLEFK